MTDEKNLTDVAEAIRKSIEWAKYPNLSAIFQHRPSTNVYWHELVELMADSERLWGEEKVRKANMDFDRNTLIRQAGFLVEECGKAMTSGSVTGDGVVMILNELERTIARISGIL